MKKQVAALHSEQYSQDVGRRSSSWQSWSLIAKLGTGFELCDFLPDRTLWNVSMPPRWGEGSDQGTVPWIRSGRPSFRNR